MTEIISYEMLSLLFFYLDIDQNMLQKYQYGKLPLYTSHIELIIENSIVL